VVRWANSTSATYFSRALGSLRVSKMSCAFFSMITITPLDDCHSGLPRLTGIRLSSCPSTVTTITLGTEWSSTVMISCRPALTLRVRLRLAKWPSPHGTPPTRASTKTFVPGFQNSLGRQCSSRGLHQFHTPSTGGVVVTIIRRCSPARASLGMSRVIWKISGMPVPISVSSDMKLVTRTSLVGWAIVVNVLLAVTALPSSPVAVTVAV
jgi:hypothetical protein